MLHSPAHKGDEIMNSDPGNVPQRQSQVSEQMDNLERGVSELSESVESLESRLSKVLTVQPPTTQGEKTPDEIVELANGIRISKGRIVDITNKVQDILNRLEL